jgi:hypothetical protein
MLRLRIDLVPKTCWYKNLRRQMSKAQWDQLYKQVSAEQGHVCCICGAAGRLHCREVWAYDDKRHIQTLKGFQAVCPLCHHVTYFGLAQILAAKGYLNLNAMVEHFLKVNKVGRVVFEAHKREAYQIWLERSKHQWTRDLGEWVSLISHKTSIS